MEGNGKSPGTGLQDPSKVHECETPARERGCSHVCGKTVDFRHQGRELDGREHLVQVLNFGSLPVLGLVPAGSEVGRAAGGG